MLKSKGLVFVLFAIVLFACKGKQRESVEYIGDDKFQLNESIDRALLGVILLQLDMKMDECYSSFILSQAVPDNEELTIWVIPRITYMDEDNGSLNLASYTLLANTETGEIVSRNYNPSAWWSDDYELNYLEIDTEVSELNKNKLIFAVNAGYQAKTEAASTGNADAEIFVQEGDSLKSIFKYLQYIYQGENYNGDSHGYIVEERNRLELTQFNTDGFRDFVLIQTDKTDVWKDGTPKPADIAYKSAHLYEYVDGHYVESDKSRSITFDEVNEGGTGKVSFFYFNTNLNDLYTSFYNNKKQDSLKMYMQPELPAGDMSYEKDVKEAQGLANVKYEYKGEGELKFSVDFEMSGVEYTFMERDNGSFLIYSYHD